jgi:PAS domain S-box-containing protein
LYHRFLAPQRLDGRVVGRVASYRDITACRRAEEDAQHQRALLEKAQEVAQIGSWVSDFDGSPAVSWSNQTCRIFGVQPADFAGTVEAFLHFVHPDDRDAVKRAGGAARTGARYDIEHRIVRPDGTVRWVHEQADLVRNENGAPIRMVGTVQDITERRQLEEQLRQAQKLEALGRLAGGVAHDLNNALTAIAGYTELALNALTGDHPARADVQEIRRAAERAESVTRQLLAFSRKQLLEPRVFHLSQSITTLGRMLGRLLGPEISLDTIASPDLPPIYGDPGQIEQALINLAVNARDAMPDGGRLTLRVSALQADEAFARAHQPMAPGHYIELAVSDTGIGMSPETRAHIFEPFFTTKDVGKGTGLGLAMVYGTVKQSGGFIFVDSEAGQGTTFRLYFPPVREDIQVQHGTPAAASHETTVLVVDDDPAVRTLIVSALNADGYRVLSAASGEEALRVAADPAAHIDLLLADENMPGMTGTSLAAWLAGQHPEVAILIMSGAAVDSTVDGASSLNVLAKPFTPRDLKQRVRDSLGRGNSQLK